MSFSSFNAFGSSGAGINNFQKIPGIIISASFAVPSVRRSISIQNIVGQYTSFIVSRTGGTEGNYSSAAINAPVNSYTDPTILSDNVQYTYTIIPIFNGVKGKSFTTIYNPSTAANSGKIYTLGYITPSLVNDSGSTTSVYISWANSGYSSFTIQNTTIPTGTITPYTSSGGITNYNSNGIDTLSANTQYIYSFIVKNGDNVVNPTAVTLNTCTWASVPTLTYNGSGSSNTAISFSFTGGIYKNLSVQTTLGIEIEKATTSPYTSPSSYTANQSVTYYVVPINQLGYSNTTNNASVNTCTWATCETPTFTSTTSAGTTLNCRGNLTKVKISFTPIGNITPSNNSIFTVSNNTISKDYSNMAVGTLHTFTCSPINALDYECTTNQLSSTVTTLISVNISKPSPKYTISDSNYFWSGGLGAVCCSSNGQYAYFFPFVQNGNVYCVYTKNYGATFTQTNNAILTGSQCQSCCCSNDGQYVAISGGPNDGAYSTNYGESWTLWGLGASSQGITTPQSKNIVFINYYNISSGIKSSGTTSHGSISANNGYGLNKANFNTTYSNSLGMVLGHSINYNGDKIYEYRYNYSSTSWAIAYGTVTYDNNTGIPSISSLTSRQFKDSNDGDNGAYNSTSFCNAISKDGSCYAVGTWRTASTDHRGFAYTTNSGDNVAFYSDSGVQHVAMSGDGSTWLTVGTSGIKYCTSKFSGTLTQGPNDYTDLVLICIPTDANMYYACSSKIIYIGTF